MAYIQARRNKFTLDVVDVVSENMTPDERKTKKAMSGKWSLHSFCNENNLLQIKGKTIVIKCFVIFNNVEHSLNPGESLIISASQAKHDGKRQNSN